MVMSSSSRRFSIAALSFEELPDPCLVFWVLINRSLRVALTALRCMFSLASSSSSPLTVVYSLMMYIKSDFISEVYAETIIRFRVSIIVGIKKAFTNCFPAVE